MTSNTSAQPGALFADSKNHYEILDGLRGVAAVMVVIFHLLETFTDGNHLIQIVNHGYLAVDFFFVLSGFVIGYAYDDRWNAMSLGGFFKRRLIRLHPMIIAGMVVGAIAFYFGASDILFPGIAGVPVWKLALVMLLGFALFPAPVALDIRGWMEMYPLNGPAWSLFYEYIANIAYALILRNLSNRILWVLVILAAGVTIQYGLTSPSGDFVGGWSLEPAQLRVGITRLTYPFLAGLLLSRTFRPRRLDNAFLWCSLMVIAILSFPRIGGSESLWMNGLFESLCIVLLFPLVVMWGASGQVKGAFGLKLCRLLGNISYPLYIVHYPIIYVFTAWVVDGKIPMQEAWPVALLVFFASLSISYAAWRWYDVPVRKWLMKKYGNTG